MVGFDRALTDNSVTVQADGTEAVVCCREDDWGFARLREHELPVLVLSTETHPVVSARCKKLGIPCHQSVDDKTRPLGEHLRTCDVSPENVILVGKDVNDLECMEMVGLPVAVADAHPRVLAAARWVLERPGGRGAVRELSDRLCDYLDAGPASG